jgi:hypothetical protein
MSVQAQGSSEGREPPCKTESERKTPVVKSGNGSGPERLSLIGVKVSSALRARSTSTPRPTASPDHARRASSSRSRARRSVPAKASRPERPKKSLKPSRACVPS